MPCERKRNTTCDPRTNLIVRTKGNGLLELKDLLNNAKLHYSITRKLFGIQIFKAMK